MTKVHELPTPDSYTYENDDCIVRVIAKQKGDLTVADAFYMLACALADLLLSPDDDEG